MAKPDVSYSALNNEGRNPFVQPSRYEQDIEDSDNDEEAPPTSGIVIHVAPEAGKARWNHIEDLDSFFSRMYCYHQKHGFWVMMLQEFFELGQFIIVVAFTSYLMHCVNYPVLFGDGRKNVTDKVTIPMALYSGSTCIATFGAWTWTALTLSALFWFFRLIKFLYHFIQFWDIKQFFNIALKIEDSELDNLTWHEVQSRIREVQSEQQMCIHKEQLTELDIYHRILRFKNYTVAMMNKNILPAKIRLPFLGEVSILSRGLRYNMDLILFWGPWSPFENNWHLREDFKRANLRKDLATKLSKQISWVALTNLILCPLIFLWQLMYFFFNYAELLKREPGKLGTRCWSQYGRLYLRHLNELDHELDARLNRAYRPAVKYMNSFSSPLMAVIAQNVVFICGGVLSVFLVLTVYDEDVMQVQHVLTIISILTAIVVIFRAFIPEENMIWCPEQLLTAVLAHVHYLPVTWRGKAHTSHVRDQFGQLFQYKASYLLNELFSPLVTPFVLLCSLRPRALDIVDFFRNFTVSVVGVGDVCSFAQMDIRRHGNPDWQLTPSTEAEPDFMPTCETNQYTQAEHGKTELSLMHFTKTNPTWKMPEEAKKFVQGITKHAVNDLNRTRISVAPGTACGGGGFLGGTAMGESLMSMGSLGGDYTSIVQSVLRQNQTLNNSQMGQSFFHIPTHTAAGVQEQQQQAAAHQVTMDFERMLHQNLTDTSVPLRSTLLTDIAEDDDGTTTRSVGGMTTSTIHGRLGQRGMSSSLRGVRRREGSMELDPNGILYSLRCLPTNDVQPAELAPADMSLSTLFLHELHHRHMTRRGVRLEEQSHHRQMWQTPHQQQQPQPSTSSSAALAGPSSSSSTGLAERTPLLGTKKS
ncbi:autophagy-related protein 9A [Lutzomyia longipalpis]|uniref:autophagy-related protein 9A n=1 Tax=Lutzomyia longipalpis TaxID=7200 RepID=UPI002483F694|nr:autophagy-related protein 9A [Lutzomyia longipalpis]